MTAPAAQLSDDDLRELARIIRGIHARAAAKRERERVSTMRPDEQTTAGTTTTAQVPAPRRRRAPSAGKLASDDTA